MEPELMQDAILDLLNCAQSGKPITADHIDQAFRALRDYQDIRRAALISFVALAKDNVYGPAPNLAWKTLGAALGMIVSTAAPNKPPADG